jgi:2-phosphosulfolactate phosphatase
MRDVNGFFAQGSCGVRFDWGATAATALAAPDTCLVVVDVLSFTTSVSVAVEAGTRVFPYPAHDETAAAFARQQQVQLAARLVLPSPNGSAISAAASVSGAVMIAAGERWRDGSLRPALEDLLGAGAVISALRAADAGPLSPEAQVAAACFEATSDVSSAIRQGGSGQELIGRGFREDVAIATELDACAVVPVLTDGAFTRR